MDVDKTACALQHEEVAEVEWLTKEEIMQKIEDGSFIPYNKGLVELLFFLRNHRGTHTRKDTTVAERVKNRVGVCNQV